MRKLLTLLLLALPVAVCAQPDAGRNNALMGVVRDVAGKGIPGAVVYVKSTPTIGAVTDRFGNFTLKNIPSGDQTLTVSFVGMKSAEIAFTGQESVVVTLHDEPTELKEVVVTGMFNRRRESFTGSASTFSGEELKTVGTGNLFQSLKVLEPALNVVENTLRGADPNTMPDLEIRGKTSIVGEVDSEYGNVPNQPLFILDGMEVEIDAIVNLPIDRVHSVTVLKDAASTAIYGSKSANGVIVVETIKPEPGELRVSYSGNFSVQFPDLRQYNLMNAREKLEFERLAGRYTARTGGGGIPEQDQLDALYYSRLKAVGEGVDSYWLAEPLRTAFNHAHNVFIDGGDQNMQYGIGLNYAKENGIMKGSERRIFGGNINVVYRKGDFTFSNNFSITTAGSDREPVSFAEFARANPYYRKRNDDGSVPLLLEPVETAGTSIYNPLALYGIVNTDRNNALTLQNNFNFTWRFLRAMSVRAQVGLGKALSKDEAFKSPDHPDFTGEEADKKGLYTASRGDNFSYNGRVIVSYGKMFRDRHNVNLNASWDFSNKDTQTDGYSITGFIGDKHRNPAFSSGFDQGTKPSYKKSRMRSTGFLVSGNYSYRNRYMADVNFRLDGSSVFGAHKMFSPTYSFGVAWNVSNEKWFKVDRIEYLKFRYSFGNPGNQNFDAHISSGIYLYNPEYTNPFGESAIVEKFANKGLQWQKTLDHNFGIDLTMADNRVRFGMDYYYKNTDPLLVTITMPSSSGTTKAYTNFGGQISRGFSGTLNVVALKTETTRLGVNFSFRHGTSEYANIGDKLDFMNLKGSAETLRRYYDGASPYDIWAVRSLGIDPATGREVFLTKTGGYTFQYNADDEVKVGSTNPDLEGVLGTSFYYKAFSASLNFRYKYGAQVFASALYGKVENLTEQDLYYNADRRALHDRWKQPGDNAKFKAIDNVDTTPMSSRFVLDENVITGESLSFGYDIAAPWLRKVGAEGASVRVYLNNIFRIASFKQEQGIEYPFSNSVSMSLSLRF